MKERKKKGTGRKRKGVGNLVSVVAVADLRVSEELEKDENGAKYSGLYGPSWGSPR